MLSRRIRSLTTCHLIPLSKSILIRSAVCQQNYQSSLNVRQLRLVHDVYEKDGLPLLDARKSSEEKRKRPTNKLLFAYCGGCAVMAYVLVDSWLKLKFKIEAAAKAKGSIDSEAEYHSGGSTDDECDVYSSTDEQHKKKKKKIGFRERRIIEYENRLRMYSNPDKIFRYFATLKVVNDDGGYEVFMTPEDFVRSLTPGVMQPRKLGLDQFRIHNPNDPVAYSTRSNTFFWMGRDGLISYTDYLFLMTLLSTSPSDFHLAFYVYDLNGDGELDKEEFERVQEMLLNQSHVGQKHRDHSAVGSSFRRNINQHSPLIKHFFGADGTGKLDVHTFLEFQRALHRDILQIEFERRDPETMPIGIISEVSFADLLLIHAALPEKKRQRMLKRVRKAYKGVPDKKGLSFDEVNGYFSFLYQIDKVDMALHFYKLAGKPLSKELLKKVAKKTTGVELSDTCVDVVVAMFDENGDGLLSQHEFISVMKKRMNRGLERPKDTGLFRLADAVMECSKRQLISLITQ